MFFREDKSIQDVLHFYPSDFEIEEQHKCFNTFTNLNGKKEEKREKEKKTMRNETKNSSETEWDAYNVYVSRVEWLDPLIDINIYLSMCVCISDAYLNQNKCTQRSTFCNKQ